jgi:undecaprenyl-diphosphatase
VELWKAALLGLVQGLTEFFPVSSDGHLVALGHWLGARRAGSGASFEAFLHVGTLAATVVVFRRELLAMVALLATPRRLVKPAADDALAHDARFVAFGSLATALAALPFAGLFESTYDANAVVAVCLWITGGLLVLSRFLLRLAPKSPNLLQGWLVGFVQVLAILPGLSRSGSTVVAGLLVGIPLEKVARLSFLLSLPAIVGATAVEAVRHPPPAALAWPLAVGIAVAFASGLFAVTAMTRIVPNGRMHWFAPWPFALGVALFLTG